MSFHAGQTFTFGEQPSATKWQYLWDNDYALADGTGISNDAIITRHILDKNITTRKMLPSYQEVDMGNGTASTRQSIVGATIANLTNMSISYTSGPTTERLFIDGEFICQVGSAGAQPLIRINGTSIGKTGYIDTNAGFVKAMPKAKYDIAANTTVTITMALKNVGGTTTIANSNADNALSESYGQRLQVIAFAR